MNNAYWTHNNNYGYKIIINGIIADVSPIKTKRSTRDLVRYTASVNYYGDMKQSLDIPFPLQRDDFTDCNEAKSWCERWMRHLYDHISLLKENQRINEVLHYYIDKYDKLKYTVDEQEWQEKYAAIKNDIENEIKRDSEAEQ
jgi:hypothetical protein